jgi:hypothetical protein
VDENEICEGYNIADSISFKLIGYVKSGATFNVNATDLSLVGTGAWTDLTTLPLDATGAFIEVTNSPDSGTYYGLRKNGEAENIYYGNGRHVWGVVEADTQIVEGEIASTDTDFWLIGYSTPSAPPASSLAGQMMMMGVGQ